MNPNRHPALKKRPLRIYISGPITGYPDNNRKAFYDAEAKLRLRGYGVLNPHTIPCDGDETCWEDWLRADLLGMLRDCNALALLTGHERSQGSNLEAYIAAKLSFDIRPLEGWL
jgi:hypothetical protein